MFREGRQMGTARAFETFREVRIFTGLDGLRALAVTGVVWQHTSGHGDAGLESKGFMGVRLFFVISGFLITTLLLREHSRTGRVALRRFYARRALRIFPVYYAVLAVYLVLVLLLRSGTSAGREFLDNLPAFATYTSNWFVGRDVGASTTFYFAWSLATEEQYYLAWPPLLVSALWVMGRLRRRWGLLVPLLPVVPLLMALAVDQSVTHLAPGRGLVWSMLASLATPILLGSGLAVVCHHERGFAAAHWALGQLWAAPVLLALLLVVLALPVPLGVAGAVMGALVTAICIREDTVLHPLLTWSPLVLVGSVSYGIYLMHMLVANLLRPVLDVQHSVMLFASTLLGATGAAYLSFHLFESPILSLKSRFRDVSAPETGIVARLGRGRHLVRGRRAQR